jgi:hypothetical protein
MMVRIKWLFIGFVAGAGFGAAAAKYGCCTPDWMNMGGGECCCTDDGAPADESAGGATTDEGSAD